MTSFQKLFDYECITLYSNFILFQQRALRNFTPTNQATLEHPDRVHLHPRQRCLRDPDQPGMRCEVFCGVSTLSRDPVYTPSYAGKALTSPPLKLNGSRKLGPSQRQTEYQIDNLLTERNIMFDLINS